MMWRRWLGGISIASKLGLGLGLALGLGGCGDDSAGAGGGTDTDATGSGTADGGDDGDGDGDDDGDEADVTGADDAVPECEADADCDDAIACTVDTCDAGVCVNDPPNDLTNECRPQIDVEFPERGATIVAGPEGATVTVVGNVHSGVAPITSLTINGEAVVVGADGAFSHAVQATTGGNVLVLQTVDEAGNERKRVQSFLWSTAFDLPSFPGEGMAPKGVGLYLDQESIDDGDPSLPVDDVASLLQIVFDSFDVNALFDPNTAIVQQAGYNVYLTDLTIGPHSIGLDGADGGLRITAQIDDILGDLEFDCTNIACELAGGDSTGGLSISTMQMEAHLELMADANHQLQAQLLYVEVVINPDAVEVWSNNPWTDFLLTVVEVFIHDQMVNDFAAVLEDTIEQDFGPVLTEGLSQIALGLSFDFPNLGNAREPIVVDLAMDFAGTDFHDGIAPPNPSPPQGGMVLMRGGGYVDRIVTPYVNDGVPRRNGCGTNVDDFDSPRVAPLEIALADDLLNQLLHAGWRGGLLEFPLTSEQLGGADGGLVEEFEVDISGMLAPTASDCAPDGELRVTIGDIQIDAELTVLGEPVTFTAYTTLVAGLAIEQTPDGIAIGLGEVESVQTELTANDAAIDLEPVLIGSLEMQLVDGLLGELGGLGNFSLPVVDLGGLLGLPPGEAVLQIQVQSVERVPGVSVIAAHL